MSPRRYLVRCHEDVLSVQYLTARELTGVHFYLEGFRDGGKVARRLYLIIPFHVGN